MMPDEVIGSEPRSVSKRKGRAFASLITNFDLSSRPTEADAIDSGGNSGDSMMDHARTRAGGVW